MSWHALDPERVENSDTKTPTRVSLVVGQCIECGLINAHADDCTQR